MADIFDDFLQQVLQQPHRFLLRDSKAHDSALTVAKQLFQMVKNTSISSKVPLDELYTDGFDSEQIWEEIELLNGPVIKGIDEKLASLELESPPEMLSDSENSQSGSDAAQSDDQSGEEYSDFVDEKDQGEESMDDIDRQMLEYDNEEDEEDEEAAEQQESNADKDELEFDQSDGDSDEYEEPLKESLAHRSSSVDDKFFSLAEMNKFADEPLDEIEGEEIDYAADPDLEADFEADGGDDDDENGPEAEMLTYRDFFDPPASSAERSLPIKPRRKKVQFASDQSSDEESDNQPQSDEDGKDATSKDLFAADAEQEDSNLTSHEKRTKKMEKIIRQIEEENLKGKDWQLMGEATAKARPVNSLLEEELEFDYAVKPVPIITEEVTQTLDDLIKNRILEQSFNDVERRLAPADYENKRTRVEISDAKPEKSLTEIYEDEYQKQKSSESTEPVKQEPKMEHLEIDQLMTTLFAKLDALTNWHFVPKPPQLELKVLSANDAPALEMEDVIPVNVSDAQKLAPQELYAAKKTDLSLKTADELTSQEKKRLRLTKKLQNKKEKRQLERDRKAIAKTNPGLGNKYATKEALKELAGNKSVTIIGGDKSLKKTKSNDVDLSAKESKSLKL